MAKRILVAAKRANSTKGVSIAERDDLSAITCRKFEVTYKASSVRAKGAERGKNLVQDESKKRLVKVRTRGQSENLNNISRAMDWQEASHDIGEICQ